MNWIAAAQLQHFIKHVVYSISSTLEYDSPAPVTLVVSHNLPLLSTTSAASASSTHRTRHHLHVPITIEPIRRVILTVLWVAWCHEGAGGGGLA
jgi:hypothetical protein